MDYRHAMKVVDRLKEAKVAVVSNAGHHLYLDNHRVFNLAIKKELGVEESHPELVYPFE